MNNLTDVLNAHKNDSNETAVTITTTLGQLRAAALDVITVTALDESMGICISLACSSPETAVDAVNEMIDEMFEDIDDEPPAHLTDFAQLEKHLKTYGGYHAVFVQGWGKHIELKGLS